MTWFPLITIRLRRFPRDDSGTTLVEFAFVISLFLLIFFGLIDFGRMMFHFVNAERAMHVAARVAVVRPAACFGVPDSNLRGAVPFGTTPPRFGTLCSAGATVCVNPGTLSCDGNLLSETATEIWNIVQGTLPNDATIANLLFTYSFDSNLGFLGGPYIPVVTVELQNLDFKFVSPLAALVALSGGVAPAGLGANIPFPSMSTSLPGEDLAMGTEG